MWAFSSSEGLLAGDGPFPSDAMPLDESTYQYLLGNFSLLNIEIVEAELKVSINLRAYKQFAVSEIKIADWTMHEGIKVFDHELAQVMQLETRYGDVYLRNGLFKGTSASLASAINDRNKAFHLARAQIEAATNPPEVDSVLESYSKWQTN